MAIVRLRLRFLDGFVDQYDGASQVDRVAQVNFDEAAKSPAGGRRASYPPRGWFEQYALGFRPKFDRNSVEKFCMLENPYRNAISLIDWLAKR